MSAVLDPYGHHGTDEHAHDHGDGPRDSHHPDDHAHSRAHGASGSGRRTVGAIVGATIRILAARARQ